MICLAPACVLSCVRGIRELHCDAQGEMMARKDLEKETERPRYYSQFWLDVAAGRRVIGAGRGNQDSDEAEAPDMEQAPETSMKAGKGVRGSAAPFVEAEPAASRQPSQPLRLSGTESLADLAAAAGLVDIEPIDETAPDLESDEMVDDLEPLPEASIADEAEPEEESYSYNDLYEEEDEDEEEEEESDDWPPSRRGKKQPHKKPEKPRRREKGRDF